MQTISAHSKSTISIFRTLKQLYSSRDTIPLKYLKRLDPLQGLLLGHADAPHWQRFGAILGRSVPRRRRLFRHRRRQRRHVGDRRRRPRRHWLLIILCSLRKAAPIRHHFSVGLGQYPRRAGPRRRLALHKFPRQRRWPRRRFRPAARSVAAAAATAREFRTVGAAAGGPGRLARVGCAAAPEHFVHGVRAHQDFFLLWKRINGLEDRQCCGSGSGSGSGSTCFGPPGSGSGSIRQRYGSGSFYYLCKNSKGKP